MPLERQFIQCILLPAGPGFGIPAQAGLIGQFQCAKMAIILGKSFARGLNGSLDGTRRRFQFAALSDGSRDERAEMDALPLTAFSRQHPLACHVFGDLQTLPRKILSLSKQLGKRALSVVNRGLG